MTVSWQHGRPRHLGRRARFLAVSLTLILFACAGFWRATGWEAAQARSSAKWPTPAAMRWQPPAGFLSEAFCIHRHESVDWYRAYVDWRGRPSSYSGGMQFTLSTWRRAGGTGHPHEWRPREQVYRAYRIWRMYRTADRPGSWHEWGSRGKCGLA